MDGLKVNVTGGRVMHSEGHIINDFFTSTLPVVPVYWSEASNKVLLAIIIAFTVVVNAD